MQKSLYPALVLPSPMTAHRQQLVAGTPMCGRTPYQWSPLEVVPTTNFAQTG